MCLVWWGFGIKYKVWRVCDFKRTFNLIEKTRQVHLKQTEDSIISYHYKHPMVPNTGKFTVEKHPEDLTLKL